MKALSMRIAAGMIALGVLLYILACSPTTQNNNSSQNKNLAASANAASKDLKPCDTSFGDPGADGQGIKKGIEDKMDASLKKLLKDQNNPDGTFTIEIQKAEKGTYFVAYVRGAISGDDNLKELSDILNDFQGKEECLRVVYFLPGQSQPPVGLGEPSFEWSSCEFPMHVCPNGECCDTTSANTNTSNVNTNGNSNSNTNVNANSNSNSNLRTGKP